MLAEDLAHDVEDLQEADPAFVEGVDTDLVRGVEDRGGRPAEPARRTRQFNRWERLVVQWFEGPAGRGGPVTRPGHPGQQFVEIGSATGAEETARPAATSARRRKDEIDQRGDRQGTTSGRIGRRSRAGGLVGEER